jgi:hypothetical protein
MASSDKEDFISETSANCSHTSFVGTRKCDRNVCNANEALYFQLVRILIIVQAILFNMFLMKILNHRTLKAPMMKRRNMMVINLVSSLIVMKIIKM